MEALGSPLRRQKGVENFFEEEEIKEKSQAEEEVAKSSNKRKDVVSFEDAKKAAIEKSNKNKEEGKKETPLNLRRVPTKYKDDEIVN